MDLEGWPLKLIQHIADATCISPSPAGPSDSYPLHLLNLSFVVGMPKRRYILKLMANQCSVCNFLSLPICRCQIAQKKAHYLSCFTLNF